MNISNSPNQMKKRWRRWKIGKVKYLLMQYNDDQRTWARFGAFMCVCIRSPFYVCVCVWWIEWLVFHFKANNADANEHPRTNNNSLLDRDCANTIVATTVLPKIALHSSQTNAIIPRTKQRIFFKSRWNGDFIFSFGLIHEKHTPHMNSEWPKTWSNSKKMYGMIECIRRNNEKWFRRWANSNQLSDR